MFLQNNSRIHSLKEIIEILAGIDVQYKSLQVEDRNAQEDLKYFRHLILANYSIIPNQGDPNQIQLL